MDFEESDLTRKELYPGIVYSIEGLISADECYSLVQSTESKGFQPATITITNSSDYAIPGITNSPKMKAQILPHDLRNHHRIVMDDNELAKTLWKKIRDLIPENLAYGQGETKAVSVSKKFRVYRFDEGHKFARHYDGFEYGSNVYATPTASKSTKKKIPVPGLTLLVYLNEDFEGGKTVFFNSKGKEALSVKPTAGTALIYTHTILHEGSEVTKGRKYELHSDILFGDSEFDEEESNNSNSNSNSYLPACSVS